MKDAYAGFCTEELVKRLDEATGCVANDCKAPPITPAQHAELERRLTAYAVDQNRGALAAEALARVRRHLGLAKRSDALERSR